MEDLIVKGKLPYPPSINKYYLNRTIKTRTGKIIKPRLPAVQKYVDDCLILIKIQKIKPVIAEKLQVHLLIYPPDEKRRDLDNLAKVCLDIFQRAGIYDDDFKIWKLTISRKEVRQYGEVEFIITSIGDL